MAEVISIKFEEEAKKNEPIKELVKGEKTGFYKDFNIDTFLKNLKEKHLKK